MNLIHKHFTLTALFCLSFVALKSQDLKMNQTQVIGSHNSYKIGIEKPLMDLILAERPQAKGLEIFFSSSTLYKEHMLFHIGSCF